MRRVCIRLSGDLTVSMLRGAWVANGERLTMWKTDDIPADCSIVGTSYDVITDELSLYLEHPSFAEVPEGNAVTNLRPRYTVVTQ